MDLSKAYEAAEKGLDSHNDTDCDEAVWSCCAEAAVKAALPHILEALAMEAERERAWQSKNWIRSKAEEAQA